MTVDTKPLMALSAADLMSRDLVIVPQEMSLEGTARMLRRSNVTGAPVVDFEGRCVGVISATDFLTFAEKGCSNLHREFSMDHCSSWQMLETPEGTNVTAKDVMTRDPVLVAANARIGDLSRMMLDAHIHRVIVVDEDHHPIGVVSSMDILAAVAQAEFALDH